MTVEGIVLVEKTLQRYLGHNWPTHVWHLLFLLQGADSVSDYPVSFHYVSGPRMLELEYFAYRLHAYGIVGGLQSVNRR